MRNLGGQTKSIMVFTGVADSGGNVVNILQLGLQLTMQPHRATSGVHIKSLATKKTKRNKYHLE